VLQEAAKHLAKSRASDREVQMEALDVRMQRIQRFCAARDMLPSDPAGAVTICQQLLQELPDQQVWIAMTIGFAAAAIAANAPLAIDACCRCHTFGRTLLQ
jgi:hypothetical protein